MLPGSFRTTVFVVMFPPSLVQHFKEFNYQSFFFPSDLAGNAPDGFQAHVAQTEERTKQHKGRAEDAKAQAGARNNLLITPAL